MKSLFPYNGGKSKIAKMIWDFFGDIETYIEPFFGSGTVLLQSPTIPKFEIVNDIDCYLVNFWRAIKRDPDAVMHYAVYPMSQIDLKSRINWILQQDTIKNKISDDPEFFDAKIAGYWVWGKSQWLGGGFCSKEIKHKFPTIYTPNMGIFTKNKDIYAVSSRLQNVRICCTSWEHILDSKSLVGDKTIHHNVGIFLDPPYKNSINTYAHKNSVQNLESWCEKHQDKFKIALCGYEGDYALPWQKVAWHHTTGHGNRFGSSNRHKERIWFSPHCIKVTPEKTLFNLR